MAAITDDRAEMVLRSGWEIESIAVTLQRVFQRVEAEHLFGLGLAIRLESLASVLIDAAQGNSREMQGALDKLEGPALARDREAVNDQK